MGYTSWWLNQPLWKVCSPKWVHLPQFFGVKNSKNSWNNHHQDKLPNSLNGWVELSLPDFRLPSTATKAPRHVSSTSRLHFQAPSALRRPWGFLQRHENPGCVFEETQLLTFRVLVVIVYNSQQKYIEIKYLTFAWLLGEVISKCITHYFWGCFTQYTQSTDIFSVSWDNHPMQTLDYFRSVS